jgi:hypothetical protein
MARLTPIERAIAGQPADRRRRYEQHMRRRGLVRLTATVRSDDAPLLQALAKRLRDVPSAIDDLRALLEASQEPQQRPGRTERGEGAPGASAASRRRP